MIIDNFYLNENRKSTGLAKENFYIGMVSQVYQDTANVQVENLSLFNHRTIHLESLVPNTINYFVVIDSVQGLFIAEVYQSKVSHSSSVHESMNNGITEKVYPELSIRIVGILENQKFKLAGFKTVGITDKVYIANKKLISIYFKSLEIQNTMKSQKKLENLAKIGDSTHEYVSLSPNTLLNRHLMAVGTTNSGKSTSSLTILDKLVSSKIKILLIDPTNEYNDSFDKNNDNIDKYTLGENISLSTRNVDDDFWINFFDVSDAENSGKAAVLSDAIASLRYQKSKNEKGVLKKDGECATTLIDSIQSVKSKEFDLELLPNQIREEAVKQVLDKHHGHYTFKKDGNLLNASIWLIKKIDYFLQSHLIKKFFSNKEKDLLEQIKKFIDPRNKKSLYLNLSKISKTDSAGETIVDLISRLLIDESTNSEEDIRPIVLFIDEIHRYINKYNEDNGLISIAREGRKKGIFLFLTTQNPKDVPAVLLGQIGTMIIHRLTHSEEIKTIQNMIDYNKIEQIKNLTQGEAILTSINLIQNLHVKFEQSQRGHDNSTPLL